MFLTPQFRITSFTTLADLYTVYDVATEAYPSFTSYNSLIINADTTATGTIQDSSSAQRAVTVPNGTAIQTAMSPFHPNGWSASFNGSTDYLTIPASPDFNFGTGEFTIEFWVNTAVFGIDSQYRRIISLGAVDAANNLQLLFLRAGSASKKLGVYTNAQLINGDIEVADGKWHHIALSRIKTNMRLFVDGQQSGSTVVNSTVSYYDSATPLVVGVYGGAVTGRFDGYISNLRIIKGQGIYSGSFIPSTTPLTNNAVGATGGGAASGITGTVSLLTLQSNRFVDMSSSAKTVTPTGSPQIFSISPFTTDTNNGRSLCLDGSTRYATIGTSTDFDFGSGDFTIEFWACPLATSSMEIIGRENNNNVTYPVFHLSCSTRFGFSAYTSGGASGMVINGTTLITPGQWYHVAVCRSGSTSTSLKLFVNGALDGTTTPITVRTSTASIYIGTWQLNSANTAFFNGYISNLRIVKGQALYSQAFTPPQRELTIDSTGTTGAGVAVLDQTKVALLTLGSSELLDKSQSPKTITHSTIIPVFTRNTPFFTEMVGSSRSYAGHFSKGARVLATITPNLSAFAYGFEPFTIEFWIKPDSVVNNTTFDPMVYAQTKSGINYFLISLGRTSSKLTFLFCTNTNTSAGSLTTTNTVNYNVWTHVALVREGTGSNQTKIYLNGVQSAVGTCAINFTDVLWRPSIGTYTHSNVAGTDFCGAVSNFRIVKGQALYAGNFVPATSPLTKTAVGATGANVASSITGNVSLLTLQNSTFVDNGANGVVVDPYTYSGGESPFITSNSPFSLSYRGSMITPTAYDPVLHGGSVYLDGTANLAITNFPAIASSTDFTIEFWMYPTSTGDRSVIIQPTASPYFAINVNPGTSVSVWIDAGSASMSCTDTKPVIKAWNHIALVRESGIIKLYLNGRASNTTANNAAQFFYSNATMYVASGASGGGKYTGYISDFRILPTTALYTGNFIPPVAPLTTASSASLWLKGNNGTIVDVTGKNNITANGTATIDVNTKKFGNASLKFNGTTDYLSIAESDSITLASGTPFTIEAWIYPTSVTGSYQIIIAKRTITAVSYQLYISSGKLAFYANSTVYGPTTTDTIPIGTWQHVVAAYDGANLSLYQNGIRTYGPSAVTVTIQAGAPLVIGSVSNSDYFEGYMDDIRITNGAVRYAGAACTVPSAALGSV